MCNKNVTVVFRLTKVKAKSLDRLAELIKANRSEVLRGLIPDLSKTKTAKKSNH